MCIKRKTLHAHHRQLQVIQESVSHDFLRTKHQILFLCLCRRIIISSRLSSCNQSLYESFTDVTLEMHCFLRENSIVTWAKTPDMMHFVCVHEITREEEDRKRERQRERFGLCNTSIELQNNSTGLVPECKKQKEATYLKPPTHLRFLGWMH